MLHPYHKVTHQELLLRRDAGSKCWSGKFQLEVLIELMQLCNFRKALPWFRQIRYSPILFSAFKKSKQSTTLSIVKNALADIQHYPLNSEMTTTTP